MIKGVDSETGQPEYFPDVGYDPSITGSQPTFKTIPNPKYAEWQQLKQQKVDAKRVLKKNERNLSRALGAEETAQYEYEMLLRTYTKSDPNVALDAMEEAIMEEAKGTKLGGFGASLPDDLKKLNPFGKEWKKSAQIKAMLNRQVYGILDDSKQKFRHLIQVDVGATGQPLRVFSFDDANILALRRQQFLTKYKPAWDMSQPFPYQTGRRGGEMSGYKIRVAGLTAEDAAEIYARTFTILKKHDVTAKLGWGLTGGQKGKMLTAYIPQSMIVDLKAGGIKLGQFMGELKTSMKGYTGGKGIKIADDTSLGEGIGYRFDLIEDSARARKAYTADPMSVYRYGKDPLPVGFQDALT